MTSADFAAAAPAVMISPKELASQMGKAVETLYAWAQDPDDPLPLYYEKGGKLNGSIEVDEFRAWWHRNRVHYQDRK